MQHKLNLRLSPAEAANDDTIRNYIVQTCGSKRDAITGFHVLKKSVDARSRNIRINLNVLAFINEPFHKRQIQHFDFRDVSKSLIKVVIVGAGPAGLFAALKLIESGIKPIILERGKDVRTRRRDIALLNKEGIVNPESNYCFGEGGAGTYSDGKLYTRSNKRGDMERILNLFVYFGAEEKVLYEAHPHIGTNKLPDIITAMREKIEHCGGLLLFEKKVTGLILKKQKIICIETADGDAIEAAEFILATGHSARDIFEMLHEKGISIEAKPFALGVRVEHPQSLIDSIQYHIPESTAFGRSERSPLVPPATYSLVQQINKRGVFSFCMCPGGIIAPAATSPGELVVNGWSPSKRNNPYASSGMVVQVEVTDALKELPKSILARNTNDRRTADNNALILMRFQQMVERHCYNSGGGNLKAPAQRLVDFSEGKVSSSLPHCSYIPGLSSCSLKDVLPPFIYQSLVKAFIQFGKKLPGKGGHGFYTNEAVVVATESRTSSPVRIPRDNDNLTHPQIKNLYPCGEGAGYAGGIVSAAMDGEKVAAQIATLYKRID